MIVGLCLGDHQGFWVLCCLVFVVKSDKYTGYDTSRFLHGIKSVLNSSCGISIVLIVVLGE